MKYSLMITLALFFLGLTNTHAQSNNKTHAAIIKTLNYYLEGGTNNDFETLARAFHPDATMKFVSNEGYKAVNALEFFKNGIVSGPPQKRKHRIVSVDFSGVAAQAKLEIEYETFLFLDYMQLLLINGEWKITSKIFYKQTK